MHDHGQFNDPSVRPYGSRIERSVTSLRFGFDQARFYKVPLIHNGDLMHLKNSISPLVLCALYQICIDNADVLFWVNTGNHERPDKHSNMTTLTALGMFQHITVIPAAWVFATEECVFCFLPFYSTQGQREADLEAICDMTKEITDKPKILFTHYPLGGAAIGRGLKLTGGLKFDDFAPAYFDLILFNDIHKHQPVGTHGYHLGATHGNSFNEADYECGWWLIGKDSQGLCIWPVRQGDLPEFKIATTEEEAKALQEQGHFVRLNLEKRIADELEMSEAPRITTSELNELVNGWIEHKLDSRKELNEVQIQCIRDRISWCLQQGAIECGS